MFSGGKVMNDFLRAYNFARRLKTLKGLTPYEYLCKLWTQTPDRFTLNPIHQMPGLNNQAAYNRDTSHRETRAKASTWGRKK